MDWDSFSDNSDTLTSGSSDADDSNALMAVPNFNGTSLTNVVTRQRTACERFVLQEAKNKFLCSLEQACSRLSLLNYAKLCSSTNQLLKELTDKNRNRQLQNQTAVTLASSRRCPSTISINSSVFNPVSQCTASGMRQNTNKQLSTKPAFPQNQLVTIDEENEVSEENNTIVNRSKKSLDTKGETPIPLTDWYLKLDNGTLCIVGKNIKNSFIVAKKVLVYKPWGIVTESGTFVVQGKPKFVESVPQFVHSRCKRGFPTRWKMLLKKWVDEDEQGSFKKSSNPQKKKKIDSSLKKRTPPKMSKRSSIEVLRSTEKTAGKNNSISSSENKENIGSTKKRSKGKPQEKSKSTPDISKKKKRNSPNLDKSAKGKLVKSKSTQDTGNKKKRKTPNLDKSTKEIPLEKSKSTQDSGNKKKGKALNLHNSTEETSEKKSKKTVKKEKLASSLQQLSSKVNGQSKAKQTSSQKSSSKNEGTDGALKVKGKKAKHQPTSIASSLEEPYDIYADLGDVMDYDVGGCMTPNRMLEDLRSTTATGAFTPPMESVNFLFTSGGRHRSSTPASPASSNIEKARNPVSDRMAKQMEKKKATA